MGLPGAGKGGTLQVGEVGNISMLVTVKCPPVITSPAMHCSLRPIVIG